MNLNDPANIGQVIGAVAVVVSLFYVAHQIRQNTNAVRSATAQTLHEHFANWYHVLASDPVLSQIAAKGLRDYTSLSEQERVRFIATYMAFVSYSQNAFLKWREIARPATVDGVGACHHEPCVRAGGQSLLERSGLYVW
jgi:hypothetical protein